MSAPSENNTPAPPPRTILLCEDDEGIREVMVEALQGEGYVVEVATSGLEALERLQHGDTRSLVLLDLLMPDVSGYEILERMSSDPHLLGERIIVVISATGFIRPLSRGVTEQHIVRGYLNKPFELEDLLALIQRWM
jgi:CheY-like chemotaxis protein